MNTIGKAVLGFSLSMRHKMNWWNINTVRRIYTGENLWESGVTH